MILDKLNNRQVDIKQKWLDEAKFDFPRVLLAIPISGRLLEQQDFDLTVHTIQHV